MDRAQYPCTIEGLPTAFRPTSIRLDAFVDHRLGPGFKGWVPRTLESAPQGGPQGWTADLVGATHGRLVLQQVPGWQLQVEFGSPGTTGLQLDLRSELEEKSFRVVDARTGAPIEGAVVRLHARARPQPVSPAVELRAERATDATGIARLPLLGGSARAWIEARGYVSMALTDLSGGGSPTTCRMERGDTLQVRVTDDRGRPLAGVRVHLTESGADTHSTGRHTAASDRNGNATFHGARARGAVVAAYGGPWLSLQPVPVRPLTRGAEPDPPAGEEDLVAATLRVVPARQVRGRVLQADGEPVVGATVTASCAAAVPAGLRALRREPVAETTDADGRFTLMALHPQYDYDLEVSAPDRVGAPTHRIERGSETPDVVLRFPPTRAVEVRLVDAMTGAPVSGGRVAFVAPLEAVGHHDLSPPSDVGGRIALSPITLVNHELIVHRRGYTAHTSHRLTADEIADGAVITLRCRRARALSGRVNFPATDGPLVGWVTPVIPGTTPDYGPDGRPVDRRLRTALAADGTFHFSDLPPRTPELRVQAWSRGEDVRGREAVNAEDEAVEIHLAPR